MSMMQEELALSGMETTIYNWRAQRTRIQWIAVGMILVGIVANWLTSNDGRKLHLILWGIIIPTGTRNGLYLNTIFINI